MNTSDGQDFPIDGCADYTGEWVRSQSRKASFIRVCHPAPVARNAASTSGLYRTATCSLSGPRFGPRVRARPTTTPSCLRTAPSQSETLVLGLSGSLTISVGEVFPVDAFFMLFCLSNRNHVVRIATRGMHHKYHRTVPQAQRLQPQSPYASRASSRVMVKPWNTASLHKKSKPWFLILAWSLTSS